MKLRSQPRSAFTLLELLVVLAIIALLASITVSAVFRFQSGQKETNTNHTLRKIDMVFVQQWKATIEQIKQDQIPPAIIELTKNADGSTDTARAKALHMKLRLRQEFPQNFGEVYSKVTIPPMNGQNGYIYAGKDYFLKALKSPQTTGPNTFVELSQEAQSAALLVLILSQGKGGATTTPDQIAPTMLLDYPQNNNAPNIQLRVFRDEWGTQVAFRRVADDDFTDVLFELNQKPFVSDEQIASGNRDPQDPFGRLRIQQWYQNNRPLALSFLASNNPPSRPIIQDPFDGQNRGPFVFSASRDKFFYDTNPNNWFNGNDRFKDDNLYSFRNQQTGRGN